MKKIVPYKKELEFNTEVAEITSISLENTLKKVSNYYITGEFVVSGEYKIVDSSMNTEKFSFELPFDINIDSKYKTDDLIIDIDDFYYELNKNKMNVNISVLLDNLEEKMELNRSEEMKENIVLEKSEETKKIEEKNEIKEIEDKPDILDNFDINPAYKTYKVYIVRENDTLESILEKFKCKKEILEQYNDLSKVTVGLKIIIP